MPKSKKRVKREPKRARRAEVQQSRIMAFLQSGKASELAKAMFGGATTEPRPPWVTAMVADAMGRMAADLWLAHKAAIGPVKPAIDFLPHFRSIHVNVKTGSRKHRYVACGIPVRPHESKLSDCKDLIDEAWDRLEDALDNKQASGLHNTDEEQVLLVWVMQMPKLRNGKCVLVVRAMTTEEGWFDYLVDESECVPVVEEDAVAWAADGAVEVMWDTADGESLSLSRRVQLMFSKSTTIGLVVGATMGWGATDEDIMRASVQGLEHIVLSNLRPDWDVQMKRSVPLVSQSLDATMHEICLEVNQAWDSACFQHTEALLSLARAERARLAEVEALKAEVTAVKAETALRARLDLDRLKNELQRARSEEQKLKQALASRAQPAVAEPRNACEQDRVAAVRRNASRLLGLEQAEASGLVVASHRP